MSLRDEYAALRKDFLVKCANNLERFVFDLLAEERVDRVSSRAKAVDRFIEKAEKKNDDGSVKYAYPLSEIQDLIGVRVVVYYLEDVERVKKRLSTYLRSIELKDVQPQDDRSFSYFGYHIIFSIPDECRPECAEAQDINFFELQIKTLFQHAWSEAEHDIVYKNFLGPLTSEQTRMTGFAASLAWGADRAFQDIISSAQKAEVGSR